MAGQSEMVQTLARTDGAWVPPSKRSRSPGWIDRTAADRLTVTGVAAMEIGSQMELVGPWFQRDAAAAGAEEPVVRRLQGCGGREAR